MKYSKTRFLGKSSGRKLEERVEKASCSTGTRNISYDGRFADRSYTTPWASWNETRKKYTQSPEYKRELALRGLPGYDLI